MRRAIILGAGIAILAGVNLTIYAREAMLRDGQVVLMELVPVDPRSLMQGDYMALGYRIGDALAKQRVRDPARVPRDGYVVAALDGRAVASFRRVDDGRPLAPGELRLRYRVRADIVRFASNAFFFQEGSAHAHDKARYGEFRVAPGGDMILTRLRDEHFAPLGAARQK